MSNQKKGICDYCEHLKYDLWNGGDEVCALSGMIIRKNSYKSIGVDVPTPIWCPILKVEEQKKHPTGFVLHKKYKDDLKKYLGVK